MKFGIVLLAGALSLGIAGCAPRNGAFGDVGATRPSDPDVVGFGELFDSALLIGPAFQNGGSSALTEQLIWEAAHDTDMAPSLWRRGGDRALSPRQGRRVGRPADGAKSRAGAACHRQHAVAIGKSPVGNKAPRTNGGAPC